MILESTSKHVEATSILRHLNFHYKTIIIGCGGAQPPLLAPWFCNHEGSIHICRGWPHHWYLGDETTADEEHAPQHVDYDSAALTTWAKKKLQFPTNFWVLPHRGLTFLTPLLWHSCGRNLRIIIIISLFSSITGCLGCHQFSKILLLTDVIKMAELKKIGGNDEVN